MKSFKIINSLLLFFLCMTMFSINTNIVAQQSTSEQQQFNGDKNTIPPGLIQEYTSAKERYDNEAKERIGNEIMRYLPKQDEEVSSPDDKPVRLTDHPPFIHDWYSTDVLVHNGLVASAGGFRQIDLKQGEDGRMYLTVNQRPTATAFGAIIIYSSSDGGIDWEVVIGISYGTARYIQSVSMLVENRSNNNFGDSTKLIVYYVTSTNSNFNDGRLEVFSANRNGANFKNQIVSTPSAGNKYEFPSSCSDGQYWGTATYLHCLVREATNAGAQVGLRHFLSTTWTATHTNALLNTGWDDYYPSIQYGEKNTGTDSIYIATERRLSATEYGLRLIATSEFVSANNHVYFVASTLGVKYEKPELTVVQQHFSLPRKMLVTCTRNRNPIYCYSSNGAATWTIDRLMGTSSSVVADYTTCNSDSSTNSGQYVIMGFVSDDGDSVNVKQMTIPPGATYNYYKRNSNASSGRVAPSTAIYRVGSASYAAFAYAGSGPSNVYYNSEQLISGIEPISGNLPDKFSLSQNYPNPFNPVTNLEFGILNLGFVSLKIYDIQGREVSTLVNEHLQPGTYKVSFNGSNFTSGVYFYRLVAEDFVETKKMMLTK